MNKKLVWILLILAVLSPFLLTNCWEIPNAYAYYGQLPTLLESGQQDVVGVDALSLPALIQQGLVMPLGDSFDTSDYYQSTLAAFRKDGNLYALPHNFQPVILLIRMDYAEKYGMNGQTLQTWDDLYAFAAKMRDNEASAGRADFYPIGLTATLWNFAPFLYQAGGSLLDESGTKFTINSDAGKAAFGFYKQLVDEKLARIGEGTYPTMGGSTSDDDLLKRMSTGEIAIMMGGPSVFIELTTNRGTPLIAIPLPAGRGGIRATVGDTRGFALAKAGADKEPARMFLNFLCGPEAMKLWVTDPEAPRDDIPARKSLGEAYLQMHPEMQPFIDSAEMMRYEKPAVRSTNIILDYDKNFSSLLTDGLLNKRTLDDTLSQMDQVGNELLQR